jgi:hypothetical protein
MIDEWNAGLQEGLSISRGQGTSQYVAAQHISDFRIDEMRSVTHLGTEAPPQGDSLRRLPQERNHHSRRVDNDSHDRPLAPLGG